MAEANQHQPEPAATLPNLDHLKHGLVSVPIPKHILECENSAPVKFYSDPVEGLTWHFYKDFQNGYVEFGHQCPTCRGSMTVKGAPPAFCCWCGQELNPGAAENFGSDT